jgi:hypothetical protein
VAVQSGALSVLGNGVDSWTITIAGGTSMTFSAGSDTFTAGTLVNGAGTFIVSGNEMLTAAGNVTIGSGNFTFSSGTLNGSGSITIGPSNRFLWSGGTMSGASTTTLLGSTTTTITGAETLNTRTLNNFGNVTDSGSITMTNAAVINNEAGATWAFQGSASVGSAGTFNNLNILTSTGNDTVSARFNSSDSVSVQGGALTIFGDGVDSGTITVAGGASMTFTAGSDTFTNGTLINGAGTFIVSGNETLTATGNVSFASANFTLDGSTLTGSGMVTVTSATTWHNGAMSGTGVTILKGSSTLTGNDTLATRTLNNFGTLSDSATLALNNAAVINNQASATWTLQGNASIGGTGTFNDLGTLTTIGSSTLNNTTVTLQAGSLVNGGGTVTFGPSSQLAWSGGVMSDGGVTNLDGSSTITVSESINARTLNNLGTVLQASNSFSMSNSAVINNGAGWTIVNSIVSGAGSFNNSGTLTAIGTNAIRASFNNSGLVHVQTGTLTVQNEAGVNSGTFTIDGSTSMIFSAGSDTFTNGTLVNGGGTLVLNSNETLTATGNVSFSSSSFILDGSTLTGSGAVTVSSATTWHNGAMSGNGVTNLNGNSTISGTVSLDTRTLNNFGTVLDSANITENNSAVINNESGATWNLVNGAVVSGSGAFNDLGTVTTAGSSVLNNTTVTLQSGGALTGGGTVAVGGVFLWSGGAMSGNGVTNLNGNSTISGTVSLDRRTLNNFGTVSDSANITESNSAVINNESGATWNLVNGAVVSGSGAFNDLGIVTTTGSSVLSNTTVTLQSGGALTGGGTVAVGGAFFWSGGAMSGNGVTILNGNSTISGTVSLDTRTLNNFGTVSDSANITESNSAVINNESGATWNLLNGATHSGSGAFNDMGIVITSGSSVLNNTTVTLQSGGVLTGGGTVSIGGAFLWSGAAMSGTGVTNLNGVSTISATVLLDTRTLNNFGTVSDNANITESNAAVINNERGATWNLLGGTSLVGSGAFNDLGILTTSGISVLNNTTISLRSSGVLNGGGAVSIGGAFLWSGGAMNDAGVTKLNSISTFTGSVSLDTRTLNNVGNVSDSAALSVNGSAINNGSGATWTIQNGSSIVGSGSFNNYGFLTAKDSGTVSVTVLNAPTGSVLVQVGAHVTFGTVENVGYFVVDGRGNPVATATFANFHQSAGTLTGAGSLGGNIHVTGGFVDPGTPGLLAPGVLTSQGSFALSDATTFDIRLNGTTVGNGRTSSGYDQLVLGANASGSALNFAYLILWVQPGFSPQVNDTFTIIHNQSNEPSGALGQLSAYETNGVTAPVLNHLVEGSLFRASDGSLFVISYVGGDGNDVTVTRVSDNFAYVRQLYADILNRGLQSAGEASYWTNLLDSNTLTRGEVAGGIWNSAEHRGLQVDQFFTLLLKRQEKLSERNFWVNRMLLGLSETDVVVDFVSSLEYQTMHSEVHDFVNALYHDFLTGPFKTGTTVAGMDLSFFVDVLVTAKGTRSQVAAAFLSSTEAFQNAMKEYYAVFLSRPIQADEMSYWLAIRGDQAPVDILSMVSGSQEFLGHASPIPPEVQRP